MKYPEYALQNCRPFPPHQHVQFLKQLLCLHLHPTLLVSLRRNPGGVGGGSGMKYSYICSASIEPRTDADNVLRPFYLVSPEQHLWNRLYCAVVSGNKEVICSILGDSVKNTGKDELQHNGDFSLQKADIDLDSRISGLTVEAKSETIESSEDVEDVGRNSDVSCHGCSKPDGNLAEEFVRTSDYERAAISEVNTDCEDFQASAFEGTTEGCKTDSKANRIGNSGEQSKSGSEEIQELKARNGDVSSKSALDVINGRFGEGGDTLLHVASRSSHVDVVLMLLECGADPAVK